MKTCLVCGKGSPDGTVLCEHCGAPLPDEVSAEPSGEARQAGRRRRSKTGWIVAGLAVAAVAVVIGVYFWASGSRTSGRELTRELPAGLNLVGGADMQVLLENEWFKKILDAPGVSGGLRTVRDQWGVDVLKLRSMAGGVMVEDGTLHMLTVVKGGFDEVKLNEKLSGIAPSRIPVAGHQLMELPIPASILFAMGQASPDPFDLEDEEEEPLDEEVPSGRASVGEPPPAEKAPLPVFADVVFGALDGDTFVMGSPLLIERYLDGGDTIGDGDLVELLDEVSDDALGWGVGRFTAETAPAWWVLAPVVDAGATAKHLEGASFLYEVTLNGAFGIRLRATLAGEDAAAAFEKALGKGVGALEELNVGLRLLGGGDIEPKVDREGNRVELTVSIPLPELPAL